MDSSNLRNTPLVSVAMATYNGYAFIAEQLESILTQTFSDFEIIIVDDHSTDDTRTLLNSFRQRDKRIQVFFNEENIGYRQTFYRAIQLCKGEYILFCDQDDIWVNHKLETLLSMIGNNLLIFSDSELINEQGISMNVKLSDTVRMLQPGDPLVNRGFVIGNCVWGHTIMFHHTLLKYTSAQQNIHPHDWWFAVISSHLDRIKYCPMVLNYYRQHAMNLTQAVPVKAGRVPGRSKAEFELQLSRIKSIAALSFNRDQSFYLHWERLFLKRRQGFSFSLFTFLIANRKYIFSLKRKNLLSQIVEIRKMSTGTG